MSSRECKPKTPLPESVTVSPPPRSASTRPHIQENVVKLNLNDFKISPKITKAETIRREHLQMKLEAAKLIEDLEKEQKREIDEKRRAIAERIRCRLTKSSDEARQREREEKIQKHNECEALRINGRSKSQGEAIPCANG